MAKTDSELIDQATVIKNETVTHANTATRVGQMFIDLIENKPNRKKSIVFCGEWDASGDLFPTTNGTGDGGAIEQYNEFTIVGDGSLGESPVSGSLKLTLRALYDAPGQDESKWKIY